MQLINIRAPDQNAFKAILTRFTGWSPLDHGGLTGTARYIDIFPPGYVVIVVSSYAVLPYTFEGTDHYEASSFCMRLKRLR